MANPTKCYIFVVLIIHSLQADISELKKTAKKNLTPVACNYGGFFGFYSAFLGFFGLKVRFLHLFCAFLHLFLKYFAKYLQSIK